MCQKYEAKSNGADPNLDIYRQLLSTKCFILLSSHTCTSNKLYKHMLIPPSRIKATITFPDLRKRNVFCCSYRVVTHKVSRKAGTLISYLPLYSLYILSPYSQPLYNHNLVLISVSYFSFKIQPFVDCPSKSDFFPLYSWKTMVLMILSQNSFLLWVLVVFNISLIFFFNLIIRSYK